MERKESTEGLLKLSLYYEFHHQFCNERSSNEKSHVERIVEVVQRKVFAFRDSFNNIEEANQYLKEVCDSVNRNPQPSRQN